MDVFPLGIDISKAKFDLALLRDSGKLRHKVFPNTASTEMTHTKTDKSDATLIARYCLKHQPAAWTPLPPEISELQALMRRLEALLEMLQQERNRMSAGIQSASGSSPVEWRQS